MDSTSEDGKSATGDVGRVHLPELAWAMGLARRAQAGDLQALRDLLWNYRERLRRIVAIRVGARLRSLLEAEELLQEAYLLAIRKLGDEELGGHASILQWLARIVDSGVRSKFEYSSGRRKPEEARHLRMGGTVPTEITLSPTLTPRETLRIEFERLVDGHVAELEPALLREVLLLRDYFGEDWESIRRELGQANVDAAQALYQRAHEKLRRRLRPHLSKPRVRE